jgi:hypothetical protein
MLNFNKIRPIAGSAGAAFFISADWNDPQPAALFSPFFIAASTWKRHSSTRQHFRTAEAKISKFPAFEKKHLYWLYLLHFILQ